MQTLSRLFLLFLSIGVLFGCIKDAKKINENSDAEQSKEAPKKSTPPGTPDTIDDFLKAVPFEEAEIIYTRYKHLDKYFQLMDMANEQERLQYLQELRSKPGIVNEVWELYQELTKISLDKDQDYFNEARWRAVHLLGDLANKEASKHLYDIAVSKLPDPAVARETSFSAEYRIHLRAIAGLEKLKEVGLLEKIYKSNGLLSGQAAASLYELGHAPKGVVKLDSDKVMGNGDSRDFKVNEEKDKSADSSEIPSVSATEDTTKIIVPKSKKNKNQ